MSKLVLITGGSGHIGGRVVIDALEAGYFVRAAVRNQDKADAILGMPSIVTLKPGDRLSFVLVPDLLADGAYDDAMQDATGVIHIASPIMHGHTEGESYTKTLIEPAVKGTLNVLEAAKEAGSVKRVVITSSVVAIVSWENFTSGKSGGTTFNETSRTKFAPEPYGSTFEAYSASKVAAQNEAEAWLEWEKGRIEFDVVHIFSALVLGKNEMMKTVEDTYRGTNEYLLAPLTGRHMGPTPGPSVHLRDVALAHVKSLDLRVPGNRGYLLVSRGVGGSPWNTAFEVAKREFAGAVDAGTLVGAGNVEAVPVNYDVSRSEEALGFRYRSFEEQVRDVLRHHVELVNAA
jgi:nucleoside-diphosphate-sugar epimerase